MARIATLTFHTAVNYGAALQMFALSDFLTREGHHVEILDYEPEALRAAHHSKLRDCTTPRKLVKHLLTAVPQSKRRHAFREFRERNVRLSPPIQNIDLTFLAERYDGVVIGSDQVWNANITGFDTGYLLPFKASADISRVSYAASIGMSQIPQPYADAMRSALTQYAGLSVREESAARLLATQFGLSAEVALDPVFLLDRSRWQELAESPRASSPFVFLYLVSPNSTAEKDARRYAREHQMQAVAIHKQYWRRLPETKSVLAASPEQFLGHINDSAHMVTNSFHGMALSTIMRKDVDVVLNGHAGRDARMIDLATKLEEDPSVNVSTVENRIHVRHVNRDAVVLGDSRAASAQFLRAALER